ncbi:putative permease [Triangularia verruculosa]|uniref:Permease n=1 Tax=Triangularia verruculosa TaxID=2587418 RepID=A0AAN6XMF4_9PEZI|nr:putative permease [Triangularia verruculosa]
MAANNPQAGSISDIRLQLTSLGLLRATEAIAWTSIFPYVYFMIRSFNDVPESKITFYAGLLIAIFTFAEFLSGMVWSRLSDRIGRKKCLLIGSLCGMITSLWLGLSDSIGHAAASRAFGGLLNPNTGLVPTCTVELARKEEQRASALSFVTFLRSLGNLVGPVLGGLLAEPAKNYSSLFQPDSIWATYPFLLPNLAVATLQLFSLLFTFLFLEETHQKLQGTPDVGLKIARAITSRLFQGQRQYDYEMLESNQGPANAQAEGEETSDDTQHADTSSMADHDPKNSELDETASPKRAFSYQTILQILSVSLLAFHKVSSDAVMPVYLAAPLDSSTKHLTGGFGFSGPTIGFMLLSQAIVAAVAQLAFVSWIINKMGPLLAYRTVLCAYPVVYIFTPFLPGLSITISSALALALVVLELWLKVLLSSIGYICSTILITRTTSAERFLAQTNSAAASFSCLARSVGPLITGKVYEVGDQMGYAGLAFWVLGLVAVLGAAEAFLLRDQV